MKLAQLWSRAAKARRALVVAGVFVIAALSVGDGVVLAGATGGNGITVNVNGPVPRAPHAATAGHAGKSTIVGLSYKNYRYAPLRSMKAKPLTPCAESEASPNPRPVSQHTNVTDAARQTQQAAAHM